MAELQQLIFEPGFSTKGSGQGGLGLAIAYLIVDAHAGRLWLSPNDPNGLCASVWLPRAQADELAFLRQAHVLLRFREPGMTDMVLEKLDALAPAGVAETRSDDELVAVLEEEHWDLLIADTELPALPVAPVAPVAPIAPAAPVAPASVSPSAALRRAESISARSPMEAPSAKARRWPSGWALGKEIMPGISSPVR